MITDTAFEPKAIGSIVRIYGPDWHSDYVRVNATDRKSWAHLGSGYLTTFVDMLRPRGGEPVDWELIYDGRAVAV